MERVNYLSCIEGKGVLRTFTVLYKCHAICWSFVEYLLINPFHHFEDIIKRKAFKRNLVSRQRWFKSEWLVLYLIIFSIIIKPRFRSRKPRFFLISLLNLKWSPELWPWKPALIIVIIDTYLEKTNFFF